MGRFQIQGAVFGFGHGLNLGLRLSRILQKRLEVGFVNGFDKGFHFWRRVQFNVQLALGVRLGTQQRRNIHLHVGLGQAF
jgi:hypothetical protein